MTEREWTQKLWEVANPLPGSIPATNTRPLRIPGRLDGLPMQVALRELFPQIAPCEWLQLVKEERLLHKNGRPVDLQQIVRAGQCFQRLDFAEVEPAVNADIKIIHLDAALMVLHKPAPLPMHPCGRFHRNTLSFLLETAFHPAQIRPAHRLDANTTGILVCARSPAIARQIQPQFARGEVKKHYLAVVHGHPDSDQFMIDAPIQTRPGAAGLHEVCFQEGAPCRTDFSVIQRRADGTSLLEVRPHTGRTNQIRVHLWQAGFPIVGDPSYLLNQEWAHRQTLAISDPVMKLHSWKITLTHPLTGKAVEFSCEPSWG
jgi:UPF0176 protein